MQCCVAFYEENFLERAFEDYWNKRTTDNPRFLGYLLYVPAVEESHWRSKKCRRFFTPQGPKNFIAFGVDLSHPRNPTHFTHNHPQPKLIVISELSVCQALEKLNKEGLGALTELSGVLIEGGLK